MPNSIDELKSLVNDNRGFARPNLYKVVLPSFGVFGEAREFNILCRATELPGRQILTVDRQIGMHTLKVAYGYAINDVTLTFVVTNNYNIRKYFEYWQQLAVNQNTYETGYFAGPTGYTRDVKIYQLRQDRNYQFYKTTFDQGGVLGSITTLANEFGFDPSVELGPIQIGTDGITIGLTTERDQVYGVTLQDAFPTSMNAINLGDELSNQLVEVTVQLSYVDWRPEQINAGDNALLDEGLTGVILGVLDGIFN
jgi:hypothetical protein